jgi:hypothetical protein
MGMVAMLESSKAPPLMDVWVQLKTPIQNLSIMLGPTLEGNLLGFSLCELMFNSCVRGASRPTYTINGLSTPYLKNLCLFSGLGEIYSPTYTKVLS